jgi:hypothetical protein
MGLHTEHNAVPAVDGTELGNLLDGLAYVHAGIDLIRDGIRHLATARLGVDDTQTLAATLAGSEGGTDVLTAIGLLVARITNPDTNPCLRGLPFDAQKQAQQHGEALVYDLADPDLHQHASEASAAITSH